MTAANLKPQIVQAIHRTMPSAAAASGWASAVDFSRPVAAALAAHPAAAVDAWAARRGLTRCGLRHLRAYCAAHGLPAADGFVEAFQRALQDARLAAAA